MSTPTIRVPISPRDLSSLNTTPYHFRAYNVAHFHAGMNTDSESVQLIARTYFRREKISKKKIKSWWNRGLLPRIISIINHKEICPGHKLNIFRCRIEYWFRISSFDYPDILVNRDNWSTIIHHQHIRSTRDKKMVFGVISNYVPWMRLIPINGEWNFAYDRLEYNQRTCFHVTQKRFFLSRVRLWCCCWVIVDQLSQFTSMSE
jgi:hypothetical protein